MRAERIPKSFSVWRGFQVGRDAHSTVRLFFRIWTVSKIGERQHDDAGPQRKWSFSASESQRLGAAAKALFLAVGIGLACALAVWGTISARTTKQSI